MLIALSGVTGVGKTYFSELLSQELNLKKLTTIRTRAIRKNEVAGKTGLFMTNEELDKAIKDGKIIYDFSVFGSRYAYLKEEVQSNSNYIFEMHYTMIDDWKKIVPDIKTIYILPTNLNNAINQLENRNLEEPKKQERIIEIKEQYNIINSDNNFRNKFDYIIYNDYTEKSKNEIINLVKKILGDKNEK